MSVLRFQLSLHALHCRCRKINTNFDQGRLYTRWGPTCSYLATVSISIRAFHYFQLLPKPSPPSTKYLSLDHDLGSFQKLKKLQMKCLPYDFLNPCIKEQDQLLWHLVWIIGACRFHHNVHLGCFSSTAQAITTRKSANATTWPPCYFRESGPGSYRVRNELY